MGPDAFSSRHGVNWVNLLDIQAARHLSNIMADPSPEPQPDELSGDESAGIEGDVESCDGDDDGDFDFGSSHTAQMDLPGLMLAEGTHVCCNWVDPAILEQSPHISGKKVKVDPVGVEENEKAALAQLHTAASSAERLQVKGPRESPYCVRMRQLVPIYRAAAITRAVSESLANRLAVLRVDHFPGSGDPVFGTRHELRRSFRAPDLFGKLAAAFRSGCNLRRLTLQGGFHSAESVANFLRVAKPPLESFRCRESLFHGRNFAKLLKALSSVSANSLLEFETDAAIGGKDPFGLIADSLPNLEMLRAKYMFGKTDSQQGLQRLSRLKKRPSRLPKSDHRLRGRPAVDAEAGVVYWCISSDYHDDGYRGEGLFWDELENTCECLEQWSVGKGVTKEQCLDFMEECGIELDDGLNDEECGMLDDAGIAVDTDVEEDNIVVQLQLGDSSDAGELVIRATTLDGREFAEVTVDPNKTLVRTLVDELSARYPCSPLAMRLVTPDGSCIDSLEKGGQLVAGLK